jgi:hypothetical protein
MTPARGWSIRSGSRANWGASGPTGFQGLTITLEESGDTLLTGPVVDQAALSGVLKKVRDLGLPLLSVNCLTPGKAEVSGVQE